jgi:hypothetical protein
MTTLFESLFRVHRVISSFRQQNQQLQRFFSETSNQGNKQKLAVGHDQFSEGVVRNVSRVKITVPFWAVSALIGTRSDNVRKLSKNCGTEILISRNGENFPGSKERVVLIEGDTKNVVNTVHQVSDFLRGLPQRAVYQQDDGARKRLSGVNLVVPSVLVGCFVGNGGATAKLIQKQFNLDIFRISDRQHNDLNEQLVFISGDWQNVKEAIEYLIDKIHDGPELSDSLSYRQFSVTSQEGAVHYVQDSDNDITNSSRVKITVPFWAVPALIGTKGKNIKEIRMKFGTSIFTSRRDENFPGSNEQVLLIKGENKNVVKTVHEIYDFLKALQIPESHKQNDGARKRQSGVNLVLPSVMVGRLMGIGGKTAFQIQERFNLDTFNFHDQQHSDLNEQLLYISGDEENVREVVGYLIDELNDGPKLDESLFYRQFHLTSARDEFQYF